MVAGSDVATSVLEAGRVVLVGMGVEEEEEDAGVETGAVCESEVSVLVEGAALEETKVVVEDAKIESLELLRVVGLDGMVDEDSKTSLVTTTVVEISAGTKIVGAGEEVAASIGELGELVIAVGKEEEGACWVEMTELNELAELTTAIVDSG